MKAEITAPVGSYESLRAALSAGASSIYFGIGKLNMRSSAAVNFQKEDIAKIIKLCRESNAKAYLALNTVVFDEELEEIKEILKYAKQCGIDAIIATDTSVLNYAKEFGLNIHISTQANITNTEAIRFFSQWADVVVLSRELSIEKIKTINKKIKLHNIVGPSGNLVRLEAFAHGALCMAISGKCYLSLDNANRSANRGDCTQICRRPYSVKDLAGSTELMIENQYIMSPKDLCTIGFIDKLINAGISILKIEGRGRPPEYVSEVVTIYKESLISIENNTYTENKIEEWKKRLSNVYNRGFWEGYYMGKSIGEWSEKHGSSATTRREYIGKVTNYFSNLGVAEAKAETGDVYPNEQIYITGATTGLYEGKINTIHLNNGEADFAPKGSLFAFKVSKIVRRGDRVFKIASNEN